MRKAISSEAMRASSGLSRPPRCSRWRWFIWLSRSSCSRCSCRGQVGIADIGQHAFRVEPAVVDVRALENAGQEAVAPQLRADDRLARAHDDEAGQVLVLGAQAVEEPGTHGRADRLRVAAGHHEQRRLMVGRVGVHGADDADVVDASGHAGVHLADFDARFAVLAELERRPHQVGVVALDLDAGRRLSGRCICPDPVWDRRCRPAKGRRS